MTTTARKLLAVAGVCLVFLLGMVAGGAVAVHVIKTRVAGLLTERGSNLATDRFAGRLSDRLNCDAGQREQVKAILHSTHGELRQVRQQVIPQLHDIYQRAVVRLHGVLRADQAKKLDDLANSAVLRWHLSEQGPLPSPQPSLSASPAVGGETDSRGH